MDEHGQVRQDDPNYQRDVDTIAHTLEDAGLVFITYAAELSAHQILAVDARRIEDVTVGRGPKQIPPIDPAYTFWVCDSWENSHEWLATGHFHDIDYVQSHMVPNLVDAAAVGDLINRVELARTKLRGGEWAFDLEEVIDGWYTQLGTRSQLRREPAA